MIPKRPNRTGDTAPAWTDLLDEGEVERGCAAVFESIDDYVLGRSDAPRIPVRRLLLAPLEGYLQRTATTRSITPEVSAAERLYGEALELELALGQGISSAPALIDGDAERWRERIRTAWTGLLAAAARAREWQRQRNSGNQTPERGRAKSLTVVKLKAELEEVGQLVPTDETLQSIADKYRIGVRTVYRRLAAARAAGLLPDPRNGSDQRGDEF